MRLSILSSALLFCAATASVAGPQSPPQMNPQLAKALEGRVRGASHDCISLRTMGSTRIIDDSAIIYEQSNRRWFVNVPDGGRCSALRRDRTLVTRLSGTDRLCSIDIVHVVDVTSGIDYGFCPLGPFVEYDRPPANGAR